MWWTTERGILPNYIKRERISQVDPFLVVVSPEGIVEELTFADIDNASNRVAWFLSKDLDEDEVKFFYMGRMDVRYIIWVLGALKAGKCAVVPSPSNTVAANQLLFGDVGAKTMLFTPESFDMLESLHAATKDTLRWKETPKFEDLISREQVEDFPFPYTFDEVRDKPFVGLHTSGTTGHPKPIYWTHSAIPVLAAQVSIRLENGGRERLYEQLWKGNRAFVPFPLYHAAGMTSALAGIVSGTKSLIIPAPGTRMTSENLTAMLQTTRPDSGMFAPSILEDMLKHQPGLDELCRLKIVLYGGGPMNPAAGQRLAEILPHLSTAMGSTEASQLHMEATSDSSHWNSFKFIEMGQRMDEVEPGLYELVYPRTELIHKTHLIFHSYPDLDEYRTKDLFSPAEGQPGWWTYRGRADNWIAMSNGLKFDPKGMEDAIGSHPDVSSAMLAGERRFRLCLLVEPEEGCYPAQPFDSEEAEQQWRETLLEKLWPTIDEANHMAPKFGRVPKELVLFTEKDMPFTRSPKGSVQRRLTLANYQKNIDEMYAQSEQGLLAHGLPTLKSTSAEDLVPFLRELYAQTLGCEGFGEDEDAFARGMDSFAVASLSSRLKAVLRAYGVPETELSQIGIRLLYTATTPRKMANKLSSMISGTDGSAGGSSDSNVVVEMMDKYEAEVQKLIEAGAQQNGENGHADGHAPGGHVIAVTGTTGSLGTYILATLLARPDVNKVICLNRAADAEERQVKALQSRDLPAMDRGRVVFMKMDVAEPRLGLSEGEYSTLVREATSIIHNAFPVNFLMTAPQFEPQYVGMLNLLEVVRDGRRRPSFLFVSSIGASIRGDKPMDVVPEAVFGREDAGDLALSGYGAAKFICERMTRQLTVSSARAGRPAAAAVLRVGQISGPLAGGGAWNIWEWLPSLVISSKHLGVAPATIGQKVDWIPVDELARITSDLVDTVGGTAAGLDSTPVYNVVNPNVTTWDELLPAVRSVVPEIVPVSEWLERLDKTRDSSTHILDINPGVKLAEFYKGFLVGEGGTNFATDELVRGSPTAAKLRPIEQKDMLRWMKAWNL